MAGFFGTKSKKKKSVRAQINKVKKQLQKKKDRKELESLRKQLRGY